VYEGEGILEKLSVNQECPLVGNDGFDVPNCSYEHCPIFFRCHPHGIHKEQQDKLEEKELSWRERVTR
jgi:hypothetical protein